jgi:hypothetical protein
MVLNVDNGTRCVPCTTNASLQKLIQLNKHTYNPPLNYINPIAPANPNYVPYMDATLQFLQGIGQ